MASQDEILQLNSDFTSQQYSPPVVPLSVDITGSAPGGAVVTINGDSGAGASGPVVVLSGGSTGYDFTAAGASITLTVSDVAATLASLGLSKNNVAAVAPTVADDDTQGYSINSLWTNTIGPVSFICQDASTGAAVWVQIAP